MKTPRRAILYAGPTARCPVNPRAHVDGITLTDQDIIDALTAVGYTPSQVPIRGCGSQWIVGIPGVGVLAGRSGRVTIRPIGADELTVLLSLHDSECGPLWTGGPSYRDIEREVAALGLSVVDSTMRGNRLRMWFSDKRSVNIDSEGKHIDVLDTRGFTYKRLPDVQSVLRALSEM